MVFLVKEQYGTSNLCFFNPKLDNRYSFMVSWLVNWFAVELKPVVRLLYGDVAILQTSMRNVNKGINCLKN